MATTAQILANRNNARKSTGPQTDEGKAVVSQNAVKHGLFAAEAVISGEDPAVYEDFHDRMLADLTPDGMLESVLAERIVSLSWRLQRSVRMQNQSTDVMIAQIESDSWHITKRKRTVKAQDPRAAGLELLLGWATKDDFANSRILDRLLLYEHRIENSLYNAINKLKKYQVIRQMQHAETHKREPARTIAEASVFESAERYSPAEKMSDLKKQSQFAAAHLTAKPLIKRHYSDSPARGDEENKANRSQAEALESTEGAGKRKKSLTPSTSLTG